MNNFNRFLRLFISYWVFWFTLLPLSILFFREPGVIPLDALDARLDMFVFTTEIFTSVT